MLPLSHTFSLLTAVNALSSKYAKGSFLVFFIATKWRLLSPLGHFTDDRFSYPFLYLSHWNPHPFIIHLKPQKGIPFGRGETFPYTPL